MRSVHHFCDNLKRRRRCSFLHRLLNTLPAQEKKQAGSEKLLPTVINKGKKSVWYPVPQNSCTQKTRARLIVPAPSSENLSCTQNARIYLIDFCLYIAKRGWLVQLQEMFLPGFLSHLQPFFNLNIVKTDHVHQEMVNFGWPQITILASDHLKWAHSSAMGPIFIPKTRYSWLAYTMRPPCTFKKIQGGQKMTFLAPSWLIFS